MRLLVLLAVTILTVLSCEEHESIDLYKKYLHTECTESSPIILNDQHAGEEYADEDLKTYKVVTYEANSYYFRCMEGAGADGSWGYYFGGCIVTDEEGNLNSLLELDLGPPISDAHDVRAIRERSDVQYAGFVTTCQDVWFLEDYYDDDDSTHPRRPPLRYHSGCYYWDDAKQTSTDVPFANGVWHNVTWGADKYRFECATHELHGTLDDYPKYDWYTFEKL